MLVIAAGNTTNDALLELFSRALAAVVTALDQPDYVELHRDDLVVHDRKTQ